MRVGQSIFHNKKVKRISSLPKNTNGEVFVIWEAKKPKQVGGCTTSLWKEWIQESENALKKEKEDSMYVVRKRKRRGLTVVRYK